MTEELRKKVALARFALNEAMRVALEFQSLILERDESGSTDEKYASTWGFGPADVSEVLAAIADSQAVLCKGWNR